MATLFDLFEVTGIFSDTTYSTLAGNLLGVVDGVTSSALNDGEFDIGDDVLIGGVSYNIDRIQEPSNSGRFTLGNGADVSFNPGSESNLSVVFLTVSNGGDVRHFIIPNDSFGDMNVQSIRTGSLNDVAGSDAAIISTFDNSINVVCFVAGTRIATAQGEVAIETIKVGDAVLTRYNGPQEVRKILVQRLDFATAPERLKPVSIERNALGPGQPARRLCVSPQHRILVQDDSGRAALVPAKALTGRAGIRLMHGKRHVSYYHLVFSRHEIIRANGLLTESFFPGPMALAAIPPACRVEIRDIFDAEQREGMQCEMPMAAPVLRVQEGRRLMRRFS